MATEALNKLDKVLSDKTSLKDVNDDVQVLLEFAQAMTDYLSRINDNQHATNREVIKSTTAWRVAFIIALLTGMS